MSRATQAEFLILQADLPGRDPRNVGVLLYNTAERKLQFRLLDSWTDVADEDDVELLEHLPADFSKKIEEMGAEPFLAWLEDSLSNALTLTERQTVAVRDFSQTLEQLFREHVGYPRRRAEVIPFVTHLPLYSLRAAAGKFGEDMEAECEDWVEAPAGLRLDKEMFVARVVGRSMEPLIPDGSLCVFRANVVGSRQGKRLLIQQLGATGTSAEFTVKRYKSRKVADPDTEWKHDRIRLEPLNPEFEAMEFTPEDAPREFRVLGEFLRVL